MEITFKDIKPRHCYIMMAAVLIDVALGKLTDILQLPVVLDHTGTMIAGMTLGLLPGAFAGFISCAILSIGDFNNISYALAAIAAGILTAIFYPKDEKKEMFPVISTGVVSGLAGAVLSTPLNMIFYDGYSQNKWGDGLVDLLSQYITGKGFCSAMGEAFVDIPDGVVSIILATGIVSIATQMSKRSAAKAALAIAAFMVLSQSDFVLASSDLASEYAAVSYDTDDGLVSAEINALGQTPDGYIWAGTYSGLYRYDGSRFTKPEIDERISSVMQLFVDSGGKLWIGTNDNGLGCYDPSDSTIVFYDSSVGLPADAIRAICEGPSGEIYVGSVAGLAMIGTDGRITALDIAEAYDTRSLTCSEDGVIAGVTNGGSLYFIKDGKLLYSEHDDEGEGVYYCAIASGKDDTYLLGTSSTTADLIRFTGSGIVKDSVIDTGDTWYYNRLLYSENMGGFLYCCENGLGFIDAASGEVTKLSRDSFDSSISDVIIDYQDNVWFASNKQGIMRLSWNPFEDIFAAAGLQADVVNSLLISDGKLYAGQDQGLSVIDLASRKAVKKKLCKKFKGVRIRHLMEDPKGNIWVSTYGSGGLACIDKDGKITYYNETNAGTAGGRFRLAVACSDGTIAAATSTGLNFIKNGKVTGTITEKDGLGAQILSMVETEDGSLIAGTDGDGVAVIKNGKIVEKKGTNEGLRSLVVLKVVPCEDKYLYVTSNAIYYDEGKVCRRLTNFPYSNNYDIYIPGDGSAWISSSAGIYIVRLESLIEDDEYAYTLLNRTRGFYTSLTANSKNVTDGDDLYLCCTDGVRKISVSGYNSFDSKYEIRLSSLKVKDKEIKEDDGVYHIPAVNDRISFDVAVLNYTLSNPRLHIYLEGTKDSGITCYQNEISDLSYTNLSYGEYTLHVQVLGDTGDEVLREETFAIEKAAQIFETLFFRIYLFTICILMGMYLIWALGNIQKNLKRMRGLQKEATTDAMTGLLNKSASRDKIDEAVKHGKGILMMIDLDSFKLVNDIYGHDMGDRILIRFSELIKDCIRTTDLAGRMGGDEFIAYIKDTNDAHSVEEKTKYINEELIKSAKDYMGKDMDIPLGASIGAVIVPEEGTDFGELYRKADKALYTVKQNGKHGYAVYHKASKKAEAETESNPSVSGVDSIAMILGERNMGRGAYEVDVDKLKIVYRFLTRLQTRYNLNAHLVVFTIKSKTEDGNVPGALEGRFKTMVVSCLRSSDVVADYGNSRFLVILSEIDSRNSDVPIDRIMKKWEEDESFNDYSLEYEQAMLDA